MATIDLGKIKFVNKGAYNNSTAYTPDDVVTSGGSSYICKLASTGNAVTNTTYWDVLAQKGTDGTDVGTTLTTQGDILYRDGSGLARLAAGTSGQALITGGSGANPSWGSAGGVVQVKTAFLSTNVGISGVNNSSYTQVPTNTWSLNFTPTSANNKVLLIVNASISNMTSASNRNRISLWRDSTVVGGNTDGLGNRRYAIAGSYHNDDREIGSWGFVHLDSPNTTSQVNYNFKMNTDGSASGNVAYINRSMSDHNDGGQPRMSSNIVAMEIDSGVL